MKFDIDKLKAMETSKIKFLLGIAEAGKDMWEHMTRKQKAEVEYWIKMLSGELKRRKVK